MSIRLKMLLPLLLVIGGFGMALQFKWLPEFLEHYKAEIIEEQQVALDTLATAVEGPLLSRHFAQVYDTLNHVWREHPSWRGLVVTRRGGRRIYPFAEPAPLADTHLVIRKTLEEQGEPLFDIELYFDISERLLEEAHYFYRMGTLLLTGLLVVFLGSLWYQDRLVFRPLKTLTTASRRMIQGQYDTPLPVERGDETGELVKAFRQMRDAVLERQSVIERGEQRLKAIFDNVTSGILTTDRRGTILAANEALEGIFGYARGEMEGMQVDALMPPEMRQRHQHYLSSAVQQVTEHQVIRVSREIEAQRKDGERFPIAININEMKLGDELFFIAVIDKISERVAQRQQQEQAKEWAEARASIALLLQQGHISLAQRFEGALALLFDLHGLDVQRKGGVFLNCHDVDACLQLHTTKGEFTAEFLEKESRIDYGSCLCGRVVVSGELLVSDNCFSDHRHDHTFEGMQPHGHYIVPLKHANQIHGVLFLYTDENPPRDAMRLDYLWQIGDMLALAVAEDQARLALEDAREKAEAHARAKSEFLANMSHEIRTPLNGMIGALELLRGGELESDQRQYVDTAYTSSERLLALINDVLDISKFEAGQIRLEEIDFDLYESMEELLDLFGSQARDKGIELYWSASEVVPPRVVGDRTRLWQVLGNLLGNAMKFTTQGAIGVELEVVEGGDDGYLLSFAVHDTGIGISAEARERIFEAFEQADSSTTRRFGGTGLGLSLSRKLVELMGGEIGVDSTPGEGSRFWFTARLRRAGAELIGQPDQGLAGKRILIVDGLPARRTLLERHLSRWGMVVASVAAHDEALARLQAALSDGNTFDLLLLDHRPPTMDGIALATAIKAQWPEYGARIVLSSSVIDAASQRAEAGKLVDKVLRKPVRRSVLHEQMSVLLERMPPKEQKSRRGGEVMLPDGISLLLVDDNDVNRMIAKAMLQRLGVVADLAENGQQAVEMCRAREYDIVLMDIQMPVMNGIDATLAIRSEEQQRGRKRSYIIALTANAMEGDAQHCIDAGMDNYLSKPFQQADLQRVVACGVDAGASSPGQLGGGPAAVDDTEVPLIDDAVFAQLEEVLGADGRQLAATTFHEDAVQQLQKLQQAIADGELKAQQYICHTLKGSSGNLGMRRLHEMYKQYEQQLKQEGRPLTASQWASLQALSQQSCDAYLGME